LRNSVLNGHHDRTEVVVTGYGVLSPIGIGTVPFWRSLLEGTSGIGPITTLDASALPVHAAGEIRDFDPKLYVRPRKSLKVMARDTQLGVAAADLACQHAGIAVGSLDPDRIGVVFAADTIATDLSESMGCYRACIVDGQFQFDRFGSTGILETYPLLFLKILPNMIASHIAIAQDARGPNNTILQGDVSGLLALGEAVRAIERGAADVIIAGGASSRMTPLDWVRGSVFDGLARGGNDPAQICRPFDADRCGEVRGEGAAAIILESRRHAESRGAKILARVAGTASSVETCARGEVLRGCALARALKRALADARLSSTEIGHINAHGLSTLESDRLEASVLREVFGEVPVTAPKSYFGNLGAASGAVEAIASLVALEHDMVPPTLNYVTPDPACPVHVVSGEPMATTRKTAMLINLTTAGQAAAVVLA
jgi:3-oxoacyl-[acyl-carrier-protein] synthase II